MDHGTLQTLEATSNEKPLQIRQNLRALNRRNWWHWWNTVLVMMLLMGAVSALSFPTNSSDNFSSIQLQIEIAIRGLLGLVLIFNLYMLYQQHVLGRLRTDLSSQMELAVEQKVRAEAVNEMSILDPLTCLYNRRFSEGRLRNEIARAEKCGYPLILLLLDLDNFKDINACHGYPSGDLVLKEFARRLSRATRGSDVTARWGGDEFLVMLVDCPPENVGRVLSRISDFQMESDNSTIPVSTSRGWAQYKLTDSAEELMSRADEALCANRAAHLIRASRS